MIVRSLSLSSFCTVDRVAIRSLCTERIYRYNMNDVTYHEAVDYRSSMPMSILVQHRRYNHSEEVQYRLVNK